MNLIRKDLQCELLGGEVIVQYLEELPRKSEIVPFAMSGKVDSAWREPRKYSSSLNGYQLKASFLDQGSWRTGAFAVF